MLKLPSLPRAPLTASSVHSGPALQPSDVFEQPLPAGQKKIEFHISAPEVAAAAEPSGSEQHEDEGRGQCEGHNADFPTGGQIKTFLFLPAVQILAFYHLIFTVVNSLSLIFLSTVSNMEMKVTVIIHEFISVSFHSCVAPRCFFVVTVWQHFINKLMLFRIHVRAEPRRYESETGSSLMFC